MNFEETLEKHLTAVRTRDLESFLETVAKDGTLTVILPNGRLLTDFSEIEELHHDWFGDGDWRMHYEVVSTHEAEGFGTALLKVRYLDVDAHGDPYEMHYFLFLVFEHRGSEWLLIHDQNTTFEAP